MCPSCVSLSNINKPKCVILLAFSFLTRKLMSVLHKKPQWLLFGWACWGTGRCRRQRARHISGSPATEGSWAWKAWQSAVHSFGCYPDFHFGGGLAPRPLPAVRYLCLEPEHLEMQPHSWFSGHGLKRNNLGSSPHLLPTQSVIKNPRMAEHLLAFPCLFALGSLTPPGPCVPLLPAVCTAVAPAPIYHSGCTVNTPEDAPWPGSRPR